MSNKKQHGSKINLLYNDSSLSLTQIKQIRRDTGVRGVNPFSILCGGRLNFSEILFIVQSLYAIFVQVENSTIDLRGSLSNHYHYIRLYRYALKKKLDSLPLKCYALIMGRSYALLIVQS